MPRTKFRMPDGASLFAELEALAAQPRRRRVPREHVMKIEATKARNRKARQKAATDRWHAEKNARVLARRKPFGERWVDRCVKVMLPGEWYADRDLQIAMRAEEDQPVQVEPLRQGMIERRRNPEWKGQNRHPREVQAPKWLYRLTVRGEALRDLCLMLD